MNLHIQQIAQVVKVKDFCFCNEKFSIIKRLLIDSRRLEVSYETLFFALKTQRNDGHKFIQQLYDKGVRNFVVSDVSFVKNLQANYLLVDNPLDALQQLAKYYRKQFNIPIIGITGSNGKTIIKEWLAYLLSKHKKVIRSPKSYNSQIGVPLSVCLIEPDDEIAIIEAGISQPGEMSKLESIISPTIGVFSNIGDAHNENFTSIQEKISEKIKLFKNVEKLIINSKYEEILKVFYNTEVFKDKSSILFTWGSTNLDNLKIIDIKTMVNTTSITLTDKTKCYSFSIPFIDNASIENAIHCFSVIYLLNLVNDEILKMFEELPLISMRLEQLQGINSCTIINDAYNLDINSLSIALDFLSQQKQHSKKTIILSDILQTGLKPEKLYQEVNTLLKEKNIDRIIGIGKDICSVQNCFKDVREKYFYLSTDDFLKSDIRLLFNNETILLKGARVFEFEKILKKLEYSVHQTVLEINLNAIINNLNTFRLYLEPETKIMVMLKAFSYGTGTYEIANVLQYYNIDYFGLAFVDEGVMLREKGISIPIMIMAPEITSVEKIIKYNLEPEIYSLQSLYNFISQIKKLNFDKIEQPVKVHIKLDTGMHRLGFEEDNELDELLAVLKKTPYIVVQSVFSHLSSADDPQEDEFTNLQIQTFQQRYEKIIKVLNYKPLRHILNSAAILRFSQFQYEMVRLGIGLYGINPLRKSNSLSIKLENVLTLKTKIIQIKDVKKGEKVGYGNEAIMTKDTKIAVIPIGYADGFKRVLGNAKGIVFVNNVACHVVGNVCMDLTMIDISNVDAKVDDEVIIFDETHNIEEFAKQMNTIPYEALTSISQRVKRKYIYE